MSTDARTIATDLIRSAAGDIDDYAISEHLDDNDVNDPDGGITEEVDKALRAATISVVWPAAGGSESTASLDLEAIEARANAADLGPWTAHDDGLVWAERVGDPVSGSAEQPNAEFIAAARADVPALAAEVRRLRAELAAERETSGQLRQDLREADDNNGFLQQHLADIRSTDA